MPHDIVGTNGNELLINSDGSINANSTSSGSGSLSASQTAADSASNATKALLVLAENDLFNETTWDRQRGNTTGSLVSAASLTTTQTTSDQTNYNARGVKVVLDWLSGTGSVTLAIQAKDPTSGKYYALLTGVAASFVTTNVYTVYPGLVAAANVTVNDVLPRTWRVVATANNANPASYTIGHSLIL